MRNIGLKLGLRRFKMHKPADPWTPPEDNKIGPFIIGSSKIGEKLAENND